MPKKAKKSAPSLSKTAFNKVCRQLEECIVGEHASAAFVCGGTIAIINTNTASHEASAKISKSKSKSTLKPSKPVTIFWTAKNDDSKASKLVLPLGNSSSSSSTDATTPAVDRLSQLVDDCEPAGFGKGQEAVMNLEYRKAGKLDPEQFATTFHPADFGIIENIEQVLVPNLNEANEALFTFRRVEAELYKLNIYSGPSGLFKKHVDTPRSKTQIGSLVVCLPSSFEGGNLIIEHDGKEADFDWQVQSADTIQWAAFYSDCEHEIKTITQGERVTLTYNLYIADALSGASIPSSIDPNVFPLHGELKTILSMPGFMKSGGVFGIFCSHAYPHTSKNASALLPSCLKGSDLVLYAVMHSLGMKVDVLPVLMYENDDDYNREGLSDGSSDEDTSYSTYKSFDKEVLVGDQLRGEFYAGDFYDDSSSKIIQESCERRVYKKPITWITTPTNGNEKIAMIYGSYGNEP
ncbi:hypothetical protein N7456_013055 [Penicillium angulare]|uniref:Fe2OG dioxygenase domain-containing protein n=1 Tax=Penicillium angulare TaxID=116970 RepID=A0A9W9EKP3_9EURO|nr:hypothetical protein N7456_013055 [Penicillium angulare]